MKYYSRNTSTRTVLTEKKSFLRIKIISHTYVEHEWWYFDKLDKIFQVRRCTKYDDVFDRPEKYFMLYQVMDGIRRGNLIFKKDCKILK